MFRFIVIINGKNGEVKATIVKDTLKEAKAFVRKCKHSNKVCIIDIYSLNYDLLVELEDYESRIN